MTDVVASGEVRVVRTKEGKDIRGRLIPPEDAKVEVMQVQLRDRWGTHVYCEFNGLDFVVWGVPDGPWRVFAWADGPDGTSFFGSALATPAEPAEVHLQAR